MCPARQVRKIIQFKAMPGKVNYPKYRYDECFIDLAAVILQIILFPFGVGGCKFTINYRATTSYLYILTWTG